jgi:hypothetical protein
MTPPGVEMPRLLVSTKTSFCRTPPLRKWTKSKESHETSYVDDNATSIKLPLLGLLPPHTRTSRRSNISSASRASVIFYAQPALSSRVLDADCSSPVPLIHVSGSTTTELHVKEGLQSLARMSSHRAPSSRLLRISYGEEPNANPRLRIQPLDHLHEESSVDCLLVADGTSGICHLALDIA